MYNKKAIRRSFLKSGTVTALGLTVMGPMVGGKNNAWSATFKTIGAERCYQFRWQETPTLMIF